jgi:hypothetical protein
MRSVRASSMDAREVRGEIASSACSRHNHETTGCASRRWASPRSSAEAAETAGVGVADVAAASAPAGHSSLNWGCDASAARCERRSMGDAVGDEQLDERLIGRVEWPTVSTSQRAPSPFTAVWANRSASGATRAEQGFRRRGAQLATSCGRCAATQAVVHRRTRDWP